MSKDNPSADRLMSILSSMALAAYLSDKPRKQVKKMAKKHLGLDQIFPQIYHHPQRDVVVLKAYWDLVDQMRESSNK